MDLLIASISLAHNFVLVTNNVKEFERVKGLKSGKLALSLRKSEKQAKVIADT